MILVIIFLGLCFGSFVNALVWRIAEQEKPFKKRAAKDKDLSITKGRSMCPHCKHTLAWFDLVPVASWLSLRGRCRYCTKHIGLQYPLVEVATALLFGLSYVYWPSGLEESVQVGIFALWLALLTILVALSVYDLKYMLLPNKLVVAAGAFVAFMVAILCFNEMSLLPVRDALLGLLAFGGVFYVLFQISDGRWIGGGDVKLGFVLGALLASPTLSALAIFMASFLGSFIALVGMARGKLSIKTRIPFGPLLIMGTIITYFFGNSVMRAYASLVLGS